MSDFTPTPTPTPPQADPVGLLISRDLFFTSKVTGTAQALGRKIVTAPGPALVASQIEKHNPQLILIDLADHALANTAFLARLRELAPRATLVAFGPHVDTHAFDAARHAGCDRVLARSKFTNELADLLDQLLPQ
jgi:DNA-binding NarL/FixJ family response regulator